MAAGIAKNPSSLPGSCTAPPGDDVLHRLRLSLYPPGANNATILGMTKARKRYGDGRIVMAFAQNELLIRERTRDERRLTPGLLEQRVALRDALLGLLAKNLATRSHSGAERQDAIEVAP